MRPDCQKKRRDPASDDRRNCRCLRPEAFQVSKEFAVKGAHGSPRQLGRAAADFVNLRLGNLTIREEQDAVSHALNRGVVGDDERRRANLLIDVQQGLNDESPGLGIQSPRRLIAQQHIRALCDGAGNRDPLLLAPGELRRKMAGAVLEADDR